MGGNEGEMANEGRGLLMMKGMEGDHLLLGLLVRYSCSVTHFTIVSLMQSQWQQQLFCLPVFSTSIRALLIGWLILKVPSHHKKCISIFIKRRLEPLYSVFF